MNKNHSFLMATIIFLSPVPLSFAAQNSGGGTPKTSYRFAPTALRFAGAVFGLISAATLGTSIYGAIGSYALLNQPENRRVGEFFGYSASGPGLSYPDFLKYWYGIDKDYISAAKGKYTQEVFWTGLSDEQGATIVAGLAAPPLVGASLISAVIARYLFNKAASYDNQGSK